jgi:hypothetical protein
MTDKKIQARNKFVGKISEKIDKLNKNIKLLLEVDQALNVQVGGGLLDQVVAAVNASAVPATIGQAKINYQALNSEAQTLTAQLGEKINTLEKTLAVLLTHISKNTTFDLDQVNLPVNTTSLQSVRDQVARLDSSLDANKFTEFNQIYDTYANGNNAIDEATYKESFVDARQLPDQVKDLLHRAIVAARNGKSQQPPANWR